jgi:outer membrane protein assembly factor BamB
MAIKFGWMEIMDVLHWLSQNHELATKGMTPGIIPMVLIPLTALTVALTSVAGIIAGWFGVKLHAEGPKQLLEVLLKKRVLVSMLLINLLGIGAYKAYGYVKNLPSFISTINRHSKNEAISSREKYADERTRNHDYIGSIPAESNFSIQLEKEITLPKGAFRSGLISGNSLFYGLDDGRIYEFNKNDLSIKRSFFIGTQVTTRPIIYKNRLYSGEGNHYTHHARIYSFDLQTGKFIGAFTTKGHTEGQPLLGSFNGIDYLFITAGVDGLYALDPLTMKEIWHQNDGHLDATVSIEDGVVFAGSGVEKGAGRDRSYATAYQASTGKKIWKTELPISNWMHPIVTKKDVCYVLGEIYFKSSVGLFYCLDKKTGTASYALPFNAPIASKPLYLRDNNEEYAFFGDFHGEICGISITKKEKMWCHKTGNAKTNYALSSFDYDPVHGVLWYPSNDNGLFALEPKTGKMLTHWTPGPTDAKWIDNYASVSIDGDRIYHMDINGHLRKFKIEFRP